MQEYVYLFQSGQYAKIGISINPHFRLATILNSEHPRDLPCRPELIHTIAVDGARRAERAIHQFFQDLRVAGEWFTLSDSNIEWFRAQTADTLIAMADAMGIKHYKQQPRKPVQPRIRRDYTTVTLNLPTDVVDQLKHVAQLDRRDIHQQVSFILKYVLPTMQEFLEKEGAQPLEILTVTYGKRS